MTAPVFVADSGALDVADVGARVHLDGPEGRHAVTVVRVAVGDTIALVDGFGRRVVGTVTAVAGPASLTVEVASVIDESQPEPRITVIQALAKGDRGELAVELLTEIGADEIVPWAAANCVTVWKGERAERSHRRWVDAARAAAKQSRRARFPIVSSLATTSDVVALIARTMAGTAGRALVLHESATEPLAATAGDATDLMVVVGPEGGLTEGEVTAFVEAGAVAVRLGPTVLRTSSAGMAAVAAVLSASARWAKTTADHA